MKAIKFIPSVTFLLAVFAFVPSNLADIPANERYLHVMSQEEAQVPMELVSQPNGPFAVSVFDEGSLSTFVGSFYYGFMGNPVDGAWKIDDRFWQKGDWVSDVTSFAWGKSGKYLYVGTANVYGDGGLFKLDLLKRTSERIFPSEDILKKNGLTGSSYASTIVSVDLQKSRMTVELSPQDEEDIQKGVKAVRKEIDW